MWLQFPFLIGAHLKGGWLLFAVLVVAVIFLMEISNNRKWAMSDLTLSIPGFCKVNQADKMHSHNLEHNIYTFSLPSS